MHNNQNISGGEQGDKDKCDNDINNLAAIKDIILTSDEVTAIRSQYEGGKTKPFLAEKYRVSVGHINFIVKRNIK